MSVDLRTVVSDLNYIRGTATPRQRLIDMTEMTQRQANDVFSFINHSLKPKVMKKEGERTRIEVKRETSKLGSAITQLQCMGFKAPANLSNI